MSSRRGSEEMCTCRTGTRSSRRSSRTRWGSKAERSSSSPSRLRGRPPTRLCIRCSLATCWAPSRRSPHTGCSLGHVAWSTAGLGRNRPPRAQRFHAGRLCTQHRSCRPILGSSENMSAASRSWSGNSQSGLVGMRRSRSCSWTRGPEPACRRQGPALHCREDRQRALREGCFFGPTAAVPFPQHGSWRRARPPAARGGRETLPPRQRLPLPVGPTRGQRRCPKLPPEGGSPPKGVAGPCPPHLHLETAVVAEQQVGRRRPPLSAPAPGAHAQPPRLRQTVQLASLPTWPKSTRRPTLPARQGMPSLHRQSQCRRGRRRGQVHHRQRQCRRPAVGRRPQPCGGPSALPTLHASPTLKHSLEEKFARRRWAILPARRPPPAATLASYRRPAARRPTGQSLRSRARREAASPLRWRAQSETRQGPFCGRRTEWRSPRGPPWWCPRCSTCRGPFRPPPSWGTGAARTAGASASPRPPRRPGPRTLGDRRLARHAVSGAHGTTR
mmetsp:Transcript_29052/g.90579  ORF Transcript_29052/g.90579 Transcript_29052/m.90579 type:complete len:500 (+) Transcript_29052:1248-2747(+)